MRSIEENLPQCSTGKPTEDRMKLIESKQQGHYTDKVFAFRNEQELEEFLENKTPNMDVVADGLAIPLQVRVAEYDIRQYNYYDYDYEKERWTA